MLSILFGGLEVWGLIFEGQGVVYGFWTEVGGSFGGRLATDGVFT